MSGLILICISLRSSLNGSDKLCGMVLSSLTSEEGQPTGLSLACSSSAITEALQLVRPVATPRDTHLDSGELNYDHKNYCTDLIIP